MIGAKTAHEVVFTSGATEANNSAIHAAIMSRPPQAAHRHFPSGALLRACLLSLFGKASWLPPHVPSGRCPRAAGDVRSENSLSENTAIVSLMWANNETGVLFPIDQIAQPLPQSRCAFHCDAVQAASKIPIDVRAISIDYLSITGHKLGAPKGVGAPSTCRRRLRSSPSCTAAIRSVPGGVAPRTSPASSRSAQPPSRPGRSCPDIRPPLARCGIPWTGILASIPQTELNGHPAQRLANTTNITFHGIGPRRCSSCSIRPGICASSGSACLADSPNPSQQSHRRDEAWRGCPPMRAVLP